MINAWSQEKRSVTGNLFRALPVIGMFFYYAGIGQAADEMLRVYMDQARILKLDRDVSKVIVGNADVADVTVADPRTIVLTGRAYGATNVVLLDAVGNAILDERVLVSVDEGNTLRVYRQTDRSVMSCAPACESHADTTGTKSSQSSAVASFLTNPAQATQQTASPNPTDGVPAMN